MSTPTSPNTRYEEYLNAILSGDTSNLPEPITREEMYLYAIAINGGGGGGGGVSSYTALTNKPRINNVELNGNKTSADLGLQTTLTFDDEPTAGSNRPVRSKGIATALAGKVDVVAGKGLSTNDYTNADKSALANKVDKVAGKGLSENDYTTVEKTKLAGIEANAQVNVLEGIILNGEPLVPVSKQVTMNVLTNTVDNLANYYLKSETYTQDEVNALINNLSSLTLEIVATLPTSDISTTTIYLVETSAGSNVYMQYAYINSAWAQLGTTQIDLTNYYTKSQTDALLDAKQDILTFDNAPTASSDNPVKSGGVYSALASKQDVLTFDSVPTDDSTNPVESGGVYDALALKQNVLTFDSEPTAGSTNPVTSGGVATALADKQDELTFDSAPTQNSTNPVTSGGVYDALQNVSVDIATTSDVGVVKPDGTTVTIDADGTLHSASSVEFDEDDFVKDDTTDIVSLSNKQKIFTGTKAQWNALPTAVKTLYGQANITDDVSGDGSPDYSTTETNTGKKWIDGKPIYRRVFQTTGVNNEIKNVAPISNVSTIVSISGIESNNPGNWGTIPYVHDNTKANDVGVDYYNGYVRLLSRDINTSAWNIYIIVEYTKTTD